VQLPHISTQPIAGQVMSLGFVCMGHVYQLLEPSDLARFDKSE
jgi:hypothetical protein